MIDLYESLLPDGLTHLAKESRRIGGNWGSWAGRSQGLKGYELRRPPVCCGLVELVPSGRRQWEEHKSTPMREKEKRVWCCGEPFLVRCTWRKESIPLHNGARLGCAFCCCWASLLLGCGGLGCIKLGLWCLMGAIKDFCFLTWCLGTHGPKLGFAPTLN
jgi:hypothetical protein